MTQRIPLDHLTSDQLDQLYADLDEARMWARHGYEIGQRSCTWSDYGVAPAWLTEEQLASAPSVHIGGNAEDCPLCRPEIDKTVLYPWICPGPEHGQTTVS